MVQKITRIPLREAFRHEAYDLTRWLQDNLEVLNECTSLSLSSAEREQSAGDFSVDLVAEDESGAKVIIENQLERSNHDHLGKLLTYLVAVEAEYAVWIVSDPRPEHVSAIAWLNESSSAGFFLVKIEAVRIGDSEPAPLLTLIVGPSDATKAAGQAKQEYSQRHIARYEFWTQLLGMARTKSKLHASISPSRSSYVAASAGRRGLGYAYVVKEHEIVVSLYIDCGKGQDEQNERIFDALKARREEIEASYGVPLDWQRLEGRRACRVRWIVTDGGWKDPERWPQIQTEAIDAMIRLEKAFRPHIQRLDEDR